MVKGKKGNGLNPNSMILLSFLLHALVLSILFFSPSWPTPRWTFGPVYTVDLVSLPLNVIEQGKKVSSEEIIGVSSKDRSVVIKKKVDKIATSPIARTETRKKAPTGDVEEAIETIKKRMQPAQGGTREITSRDNVEMTMKMRVYYSVIWSKIREQWILPEGILSHDNYEAIVAVKILRNGKVVDLEFEKRSGNRYFDESVAKAIKKASPLPALPEWLMRSSLDVGVRFRSSEIL